MARDRVSIRVRVPVTVTARGRDRGGGRGRLGLISPCRYITVYGQGSRSGLGCISN